MRAALKSDTECLLKAAAVSTCCIAGSGGTLKFWDAGRCPPWSRTKHTGGVLRNSKCLLRPERLCCLANKERCSSADRRLPEVTNSAGWFKRVLLNRTAFDRSKRRIGLTVGAQEGRHTYSKTPELLLAISAVTRWIYDGRKVQVACFKGVELWDMSGLLSIYPPLEAHSVCLVRHSATAAV
jgi:hypothetical protein